MTTANNNDENTSFKSKIPRRQLPRENLPFQRPLTFPFQYTGKLYIMHFFYSFVSRMWEMGIVLLIAIISNNSLFLVAVVGFLSSLSIFLFMSIIGSWLDKTDRLVAVKISLLIKFTSITLAYIICACISHASLLHQEIRNVALYSIPVLCALVGLSFSTITQSIEKDWLVVLSDGSSTWLTTTNSVMSQIDLLCKSLAPVVTGIFFSIFSTSAVSIILLLANFLSTVLLYVFMTNLYNSWPALSVRSGPSEMDSELTTNNCAKTMNSSKYIASYQSINSTELDGSISKLQQFSDGQDSFEKKGCISLFDSLPFVSQWVKDWRDFAESGCAGVMISYSFLFLTVLSFGSLMTVYLQWAGMNDTWIGVSRGLAALMGFTGALIFPLLNRYFGLWLTAEFAIVFQCGLVTLAASAFFWPGIHKELTMVVMVTAVLISRIGLWIFDLSARQIAQETIPEACRGKVNGQWRAIIAFFEMSSFVLAMWVSEPEHFSFLTSLSALMVFLAMFLYIVTRPRKDSNDGDDDTEHNDDDVGKSSSKDYSTEGILMSGGGSNSNTNSKVRSLQGGSTNYA